MPQAKERSARPGDRIIVEGKSVGVTQRVGEIVELLGDSGHEHYRVRWEDGHESIFFPSSDARIRYAED